MATLVNLKIVQKNRERQTPTTSPKRLVQPKCWEEWGNQRPGLRGGEDVQEASTGFGGSFECLRPAQQVREANDDKVSMMHAHSIILHHRMNGRRGMKGI